MRKPPFEVRIDAPFLKDPTVSPTAKLMYAILKAVADAGTKNPDLKGRCLIAPRTVEKLLGCSRGKREAAQRELTKLGRLRLDWRRGACQRFARRVFVVLDSPLPVFTAAVKTSNLYQSPQSGQVTSLTTDSDRSSAAKPIQNGELDLT